ncbi:hypothetical protein TIFTF001_027571 [Ficus carica]|uniref:Uncharacterized protein n=1 Tax=Ficus carica TaxID=3494 RepID=A0AA88DPI0_FICCA|nr:hypothetical protein TIFTF001_027571 [Ficus carica]
MEPHNENIDAVVDKCHHERMEKVRKMLKAETIYGNEVNVAECGDLVMMEFGIFTTSMARPLQPMWLTSFDSSTMMTNFLQAPSTIFSEKASRRSP